METRALTGTEVILLAFRVFINFSGENPISHPPLIGAKTRPERIYLDEKRKRRKRKKKKRENSLYTLTSQSIEQLSFESAARVFPVLRNSPSSLRSGKSYFQVFSQVIRGNVRLLILNRAASRPGKHSWSEQLIKEPVSTPSRILSGFFLLFVQPVKLRRASL